jgi:hypothetical protein
VGKAEKLKAEIALKRDQMLKALLTEVKSQAQEITAAVRFLDTCQVPTFRNGDGEPRTPIRFSARYNCGIAPSGGLTARQAFPGQRPVYRGRKVTYIAGSVISRTLRLLVPMQAKTCGFANVPADAAMISKGQASVIVVGSATAGRILKIQSWLYAKQCCDVFLKAAEELKKAGAGQLVPCVYGHGTCPQSGASWILMELCPATQKCPGIHQCGWPRVLFERIIPALEPVYAAQGFKTWSGTEWRHQIMVRMQGKHLEHECQAALARLGNLMNDKQFLRTPCGLTSGDLQPQNVHLGNGAVKVIDWSNDVETSLVVDAFGAWLLPALADHGARNLLWDFAGGQTALAEMPAAFRLLCDRWMSWVQRVHGLAYSESDLRIHLLCAAWDWLGSQIGPWQPDGQLWPHRQPSKALLKACSAVESSVREAVRAGVSSNGIC